MEGLAVRSSRPSIACAVPDVGGYERSLPTNEGFLKIGASNPARKLGFVGVNNGSRLKSLLPIMAGNVATNASLTADFPAISDEKLEQTSTNEKTANIVWHESSICRCDRHQLLQQKGCVIWITGLSGSGKSTVACALSRALYQRGKLTYTLDGDNVRHGLNSDLSFKAGDRTENIRRIGEVAKLFADAGVICIASLISPYRKDRAACRALLPEGDFIEVFMDVPIHVCESRDPKGLYKLARAGKIKGFTGVDDPYEAPLDCEIVLEHKGDEGSSSSPCEMAEAVVTYLEENGYLEG